MSHASEAPPAGTVLNRRTLNRTLLVRQSLLQRTATPVPAMLERLVGMQAQVPRDPYISMWSRLRTFEPAALEKLLVERDAVRMTLMRTTLHLVSATDALRLRAVMQVVCERAFASSPFARQLDGIDRDALLDAGAAIVAAEPRAVAELGRKLGERWPGFDPTSLAYAVRYLVPLVQVTPRGLFGRTAAPRVTTLAAWLDRTPWPIKGGDPPERSPDETVLRYLRAFGPATLADVRAWSWLTGLRAVAERLGPGLRRYRDEAGRELFDVPDGAFASPDQPAPVRFLGEYDNVFLSHADRSRITGDLSWGAGYVRQGAFFVDGFLAGAWRHAVSEGRATIAVQPRRRLAPREREDVRAEGEALLRFLSPTARSWELGWTA